MQNHDPDQACYARLAQPNLLDPDDTNGRSYGDAGLGMVRSFVPNMEGIYTNRYPACKAMLPAKEVIPPLDSSKGMP